MTKALFNGSLEGFSGRIGNLIFRQLPNGKTVVTQAPPKMTRKEKEKYKRKRSKSQNEHNDRFQEASAYARWAAQTQRVYAELAAVAPMMTAYNFAVSDWFHAPVVHRVERQAGCIRVEASDNVRVTRVQVTLLSHEGVLLEEGEAVRAEGNWWEFTPDCEGTKVMTRAWDLPGHVTQFISG
jgi:hypothetical protein